MKSLTIAMVIGAALLVQVWGASAGDERIAQATGSADKPAAQSDKPAAPAEPMPGKGAARMLKMRGTISAIDKDKGTVTLKGPKGGTLTLDVQDKSKLDAIKVGDPVVGTYLESIVIQVVKSGSASPGATVQETRVSSKPGETPAGAIARQVTVTTTIVGINKKAHTVTIKGPQGDTRTIKAQDPKNLDKIKTGDLVDITYTEALAVALDKSAK